MHHSPTPPGRRKCVPQCTQRASNYTRGARWWDSAQMVLFSEITWDAALTTTMVRKLVPSATPTSTTSTSICAEIGCFLNLENNVNLHMLSLRCVGFSFLVPQKYTNLDDFTPFSGNNFCGSIFFCWMMISIWWLRFDAVRPNQSKWTKLIFAEGNYIMYRHINFESISIN